MCQASVLRLSYDSGPQLSFEITTNTYKQVWEPLFLATEPEKLTGTYACPNSSSDCDGIS